MQTRKYRVGFILTTKLGNATRFQIIKKYAERDESIICFWAPIDYSPVDSRLVRLTMKLPLLLRWRAIVVLQSSPVIARLNTLDAVVVHQFEPSVLLSMRRTFKTRPILVNSSDDTPLVPGREHPMYDNEIRRNPWLQRLRFKLDIWRARRADLTIPMSTWAAKILVDDCGVERLSVLPLHVGMDLEEWPAEVPRQLKNSKLRLLFVGGDFERKGGNLLLEVHQAEFADDVELHIVSKNFGSMSYKNVYIYNDIESNDLRLKMLYRDCDIFVLPTLSDLSSWVCLEAMASSRPVISTNVAGITDIVKHNQNGLIVAKGSASELSNAISELLSNSDRRVAMGLKGREIVEREFNAQRNVPAILAFIKQGIDDKLFTVGSAFFS